MFSSIRWLASGLTAGPLFAHGHMKTSCRSESSNISLVVLALFVYFCSFAFPQRSAYGVVLIPGGSPPRNC
jgi:hypothetical protein